MVTAPLPTRRLTMRLLLALAALTVFPRGIPAQPASSASAPVARLNQALLELMKSSGREPSLARLQRFLPVMQETFDLEAALRVIAAPYYDRASEAERKEAISAFTRRSAAQYVERFDSYDGQSIDIIGERAGPRSTTLVDTNLKKPGKDPVRLTYVLRQEGGGWKILDVLAKGTISQVATQRSDFQTSLRSGGLAGLTRDLHASAEQLLGRS